LTVELPGKALVQNHSAKESKELLRGQEVVFRQECMVYDLVVFMDGKVPKVFLRTWAAEAKVE
jgi:hypothetical protein